MRVYVVQSLLGHGKSFHHIKCAHSDVCTNGRAIKHLKVAFRSHLSYSDVHPHILASHSRWLQRHRVRLPSAKLRRVSPPRPRGKDVSSVSVYAQVLLEDALFDTTVKSDVTDVVLVRSSGSNALLTVYNFLSAPHSCAFSRKTATLKPSKGKGRK